MKILVPISLGELYDKQSILWVKLTNIKDPEKLKNIQKEYDLLSELCKQYPIEHHYWYDLIHVNNHLWAVEDNIRNKESKKEYDDQFISFAREVYYTNDKRSEIKKEINIKYNSEIIEEKSYEKYT
jgi:hypothetical protein